MTLTLPQSKGGLKTYNGAGAVIMRSTDDEVEIYVSLHVDADTVIDGSLTIHANLVVDGTTDLGGDLTLTADLDANGHTIAGGTFETTGGLSVSGGVISFGAVSMSIAGGFLELTGGGIKAPGANITGTMQAEDFVAVGTGFSSFAGDMVLANGDVTCVALHETSARAGKADIRPLEGARRLLDVPTVTFRKARDTGARRQVGLLAEDVAAAGLDELVGRDEDGNPASLTYSRVVAVLLEIVREQDERIERLERAATSP